MVEKSLSHSCRAGLPGPAPQQRLTPSQQTYIYTHILGGHLKLHVIAVCAAICALYAQNPSATLVGTVTDPSGLAVAGAKVKVLASATNQVRKTESDSKGAFIVPNLAPG